MTEEKRMQVRVALLGTLGNNPSHLSWLLPTIGVRTHTDREEVMGVIWEMVDEGSLSYGADALVRIVR